MESSPGGLRARQLAVRALLRVEQEDAYLPLALRGLWRRHRVTPVEAAVATALATGVLRWKSRLDFALQQVSSRPLSRVEPALLQILRVAAFEVGFAKDTPAPVAVDLAVRQARALGRGQASFANAVLRALVRESEDELPSPRSGPAYERLAVTYGHPVWLVRRWLDRFGASTTEAILKANNQPPPLTVRVNLLRTSPQELRARWQVHGIESQEGTLAPEAVILDRPRMSVESLPGFEEGLFTPQSEASMLPARVLAAEPGMLVADLCAAPGGKATHLAELSGDEAVIVALDVHLSRLALVRENARRLGLRSIRAVGADAVRAPLAPQRFDAVLLDAPCTALGTVARRPDVRWRRRPEDVAAMARLQADLLDAAVELVRPGGRLVYSVCSFEPEETTDHVRRLLQRGGWEVMPVRESLPACVESRRVEEDGFGVTLLPHQFRTDGFFVVRFDRRARV